MNGRKCSIRVSYNRVNSNQQHNKISASQAALEGGGSEKELLEGKLDKKFHEFISLHLVYVESSKLWMWS